MSAAERNLRHTHANLDFCIQQRDELATRLAEAVEAAERATAMAERYGDAIVSISAVEGIPMKARLVIAELDATLAAGVDSLAEEKP